MVGILTETNRDRHEWREPRVSAAGELREIPRLSKIIVARSPGGVRFCNEGRERGDLGVEICRRVRRALVPFRRVKVVRAGAVLDDRFGAGVDAAVDLCHDFQMRFPGLEDASELREIADENTFEKTRITAGSQLFLATGREEYLEEAVKITQTVLHDSGLMLPNGVIVEIDPARKLLRVL